MRSARCSRPSASATNTPSTPKGNTPTSPSHSSPPLLSNSLLPPPPPPPTTLQRPSSLLTDAGLPPGRWVARRKRSSREVVTRWGVTDSGALRSRVGTSYQASDIPDCVGAAQYEPREEEFCKTAYLASASVDDKTRDRWGSLVRREWDGHTDAKGICMLGLGERRVP